MRQLAIPLTCLLCGACAGAHANEVASIYAAVDCPLGYRGQRVDGTNGTALFCSDAALSLEQLKSGDVPMSDPLADLRAALPEPPKMPDHLKKYTSLSGPFSVFLPDGTKVFHARFEGGAAVDCDGLSEKSAQAAIQELAGWIRCQPRDRTKYFIGEVQPQ